ncbi:MAG: 4-hydroxy-tetrahydrodipicolinate synthase [Gammaproteobacteria bacterium]|nr:4-hydroxy-tetrahydrodipicolinate synthase [Gammaproteobacteria bacterium]
MFRGSMVALVTPMQNGELDLERLRALVEYHIGAGTHALVAAGTTGESGTLSYDEKCTVIKTVIEAASERVPVIAGTAANATQDCMKLTEAAMELGAHAALIMTPAYIKPTQEGLYQHYKAIAEAVHIPIILYNVPGRTACDLLPETVIKLADISNIIGIKEATGDMTRLEMLVREADGRLDVYSGDDPTAAGWILKGAKGVISVTANVAPKQMVALVEAALDRDEELTAKLQAALLPLHEGLFVEANPIPSKWALAEMGLIRNELRLPLTSLASQYHAGLSVILRGLDLI